MRPEPPTPQPEPQTPPPAYNIDELAALAGVTRRTVRYYVTRGLLPSPTGLGRGRHYTAEHLARLVEIRERQEAGEPLSEIEARLSCQDSGAPSSGTPPPGEAPGLEPWTRLIVEDGIELHLRGVRLDPARARQIQLAVLQALAQLEAPRKEGRR
jgi:DNA-binding transcriptional MerR regulator